MTLYFEILDQDGKVNVEAETLSDCSYCFRSQFATALGSNRTHVPMRNEGMRPAFACLKIVTCETAKILESSLAVRA